MRSARQAIKHGRDAAEDLIEEAQHTVKQRPLQTIGIAFAAGVLREASSPGLDAVVVERKRFVGTPILVTSS